MRILPLAEAKSKLSQLVAHVEATDTEITITKHGWAAAVLVSYDEFESWRETLALLSDRQLMRELRRGMTALKRGRGKTFRTSAELDRLFEGGR